MKAKDKIEKMNKSFEITSVCREDLKEYFSDKQIESLEDCDMERLARKMADAYCENGFWIDMEILAQAILDNKKEA